MKNLKMTLVIITLCMLFQTFRAQNVSESRPFFIPKVTSLSASSNFRWFISGDNKKQLVDKMDLRARLKFSRDIQLVITDRMKYLDQRWQTELSDFYIDYSSTFYGKKKLLFFAEGTRVNFKVGKQEVFTPYPNIQVMLENAERIINTPVIYGVAFTFQTSPLDITTLDFFVNAHSGDLIYDNLEAELLDLYLKYKQFYIGALGFTAQTGITRGSNHAVNFAHIIFEPVLEKVELNFKLGKLITYDESPYGFHIGVTRRFKYISLGGYYEKRINQKTKGNIAAIQWQIIGPPYLAKIFSTFSLAYDFNTNSLFALIPMLKLDFYN